MVTVEKRSVSIFVDKACPQNWIVRDANGEFWIVPPVENAWNQRQALDLKETMELEPIPSHYKYLLGLPV
jgi:hypothetical protein